MFVTLILLSPFFTYRKLADTHWKYCMKIRLCSCVYTVLCPRSSQGVSLKALGVVFWLLDIITCESWRWTLKTWGGGRHILSYMHTFPKYSISLVTATYPLLFFADVNICLLRALILSSLLVAVALIRPLQNCSHIFHTASKVIFLSCKMIACHSCSESFNASPLSSR